LQGVGCRGVSRSLEAAIDQRLDVSGPEERPIAERDDRQLALANEAAKR
jgi:hypothetical protein